MSPWILALLIVSWMVGLWAAGYAAFLGATMIPSFQSWLVYLNRPKPANSKDLNKPERFGFLHKQVTPFHLLIEDDSDARLYVWHILPLRLYRWNHEELINQKFPDRPLSLEEFKQTKNFDLLRHPDTRLVISLHGAGGHLASGIRPLSYRAVSATAADPIHVLAFDYRGFGLSDGKPSESSLLRDAMVVVEWALHVAGIPPERIVLFGHSLGSAVAIALANSLTLRTPAISCAGLVIAGSFTDILTVGKSRRIFLPIAKIRPWLAYFERHFHSKWVNTHQIAEFVQESSRYHIAFVHAENDPVIPIANADSLLWHAINAANENKISEDTTRTRHGEGGRTVEWETKKGAIFQDIWDRGGHNLILLFPVVEIAILRAFAAADPDFKF